MEKADRIIFKDQICDVVFNEETEGEMTVKCQRGAFTIKGSIEVQFSAYRIFCKGCDKIRIVDRKQHEEAFRDLADVVAKEAEIDD